MSNQMWKCLKCGAEFTPQNQTFQCTRCFSNSTISLKGLEEINNSKEKQVEAEKMKSRKCVLCGADTVLGFLQDRGPLTIISTYSLHWVKDVGFSKGYFVFAYACPSCGKVDLWLNERDLSEGKF